jgi:tetratricopeptide (TPR) repeat protein
MFAEAWYNLSDLLDEQGQSEAAIDCLHRALRAAPDYVDAIFNLALLLPESCLSAPKICSSQPWWIGRPEAVVARC